jgi:hypothetical protein
MVDLYIEAVSGEVSRKVFGEVSGEVSGEANSRVEAGLQAMPIAGRYTIGLLLRS